MRTFSWADFASLFAAMQWTVALVCIALAVGAPLGLGLALLRGHRWRRCAGWRRRCNSWSRACRCWAC